MKNKTSYISIYDLHFCDSSFWVTTWCKGSHIWYSCIVAYYDRVVWWLIQIVVFSSLQSTCIVALLLLLSQCLCSDSMGKRRESVRKTEKKSSERDKWGWPTCGPSLASYIWATQGPLSFLVSGPSVNTLCGPDLDQTNFAVRVVSHFVAQYAMRLSTSVLIEPPFLHHASKPPITFKTWFKIFNNSS